MSKAALATSSLVGAVAGFCAAYVFLRPTNRSKELEPRKRNEDENLIWAEQLVRNRQFFGERGQRLIEESYVVVVGVGGVGSHCAISLARSGVGKLRLIDFDQVSLSSLNRHACATRADIGLSKVEVLRDSIHSICPHTQVEICPTLFKGPDAKQLLCEGFGQSIPDFVVDNIDNVPTKVDLITFCYRNHIPCISSGGAGGKSNPTKIRIDDIADTVEDELSRAIRLRLRKEGIESGPMFCYSTERYSKDLVPLQEFQKESIDDYKPFEQFRVRVIPVIGPIPAIFGHAMASYVLCELADQPIGAIQTATKEAAAVDRISRRNYRQLFEAIKQYANQEGKAKTNTRGLELEYMASREIYTDQFLGCSVISGKQLAPRALQIVPWRLYENSLEISFGIRHNLVCMSQQEAKIHLKIFPLPNVTGIPTSIESIWDADIINRVDAFLKNGTKIITT